MITANKCFKGRYPHVKHTYLETDQREWMVKCSELRALYELKNSAYWQNEIAACAGDSKKLWNVFHTVFGETCSVDTDLHTADEFAAFFKDKVESVRTSTDSTPLYDIPSRMTYNVGALCPSDH